MEFEMTGLSRQFTLAPLALALAWFASQAQSGTPPQLMITNSSNETVMLYSSFDGSLIDSSFIDAKRMGLTTSVFVEARPVGEEVWVTDQLEDAVFRFSADGKSFLGTIANPALNGPEGFEIVNGTALIASRDGIHAIDTHSMLYLGLNAYRGTDSSVNDVTFVDGSLLVSNSDSDSIDIINLDGNFVSSLVKSDSSNELNFPTQISRTPDNGFLVAGLGSPSGVFEFNIQGELLSAPTVLGSSPRGAYRLGNGNLMYTSSQGVFIYDLLSGSTKQVGTGRSNFISELVPSPGVLTSFSITALLPARRKRA